MEVFTLTSVVRCKYVELTCVVCGHTAQADGKHHGLLVLTRQRAFSLEVLYGWQFNFIWDDRTYYSYWRDVVSRYVERRDANGVWMDADRWFNKTLKAFTLAVKGFIMLHYMDFVAAFACQCEGGFPTHVQADATSVGWRKAWARLHQAHRVPVLRLQGSKFQDRVFINDCDTRETILRWFKPQTAPGGFVRGGVMPQKEEMDAVCRRLVGFGLNGMAFMIRTAFTGPDLSPGEAHPTGHPFLEMIRVLALKAPCCHLVLPAIFDDVQAIIDGAPVVRHYSRIYEASPLLGRLICVARGGALPHELRGILAAVKAKAVAPFAGSRRPDVASGSEPPDDPDAGGSSDTSVANDGSNPRTWSETEAFLRTGVWSGLPREF
mmetsp:Transcript_25928/g.66729  ORF Transcript_25928/g.66729 Transcript_25928/m.66729 type:complete len:378 (+) Transcript_25928:1426-2559(+)